MSCAGELVRCCRNASNRSPSCLRRYIYRTVQRVGAYSNSFSLYMYHVFIVCYLRCISIPLFVLLPVLLRPDVDADVVGLSNTCADVSGHDRPNLYIARSDSGPGCAGHRCPHDRERNGISSDTLPYRRGRRRRDALAFGSGPDDPVPYYGGGVSLPRRRHLDPSIPKHVETFCRFSPES